MSWHESRTPQRHAIADDVFVRSLQRLFTAHGVAQWLAAFVA